MCQDSKARRVRQKTGKGGEGSNLEAGQSLAEPFAAAHPASAGGHVHVPEVVQLALVGPLGVLIPECVEPVQPPNLCVTNCDHLWLKLVAAARHVQPPASPF